MIPEIDLENNLIWDPSQFLPGLRVMFFFFFLQNYWCGNQSKSTKVGLISWIFSVKKKKKKVKAEFSICVFAEILGQSFSQIMQVDHYKEKSVVNLNMWIMLRECRSLMLLCSWYWRAGLSSSLSWRETDEGWLIVFREIFLPLNKYKFCHSFKPGFD